MNISASDHFSSVDLGTAYSARRGELPEELAPSERIADLFGAQIFRGISFDLGSADGNNVVLLDQAPVRVELNDICATYLIFAHVVENREPSEDKMGGLTSKGNDLGDHVSDYVLEYADGSTGSHAILRRFAIQQESIIWGASAFACVPSLGEQTRQSTRELVALERGAKGYGHGEVRHSSGREGGGSGLWLYALANPHPDRSLKSVRLEPRTERSAVYGIATTELPDHPLRYPPRRKLLLTLPPGVEFNAIGEIDEIDIDLGNVISARQQSIYDAERWSADDADVQPDAAADRVIVEYAAHPAACLYVGRPDGEPLRYALEEIADDVVTIAAAHRPVTIKVIDKATRHPVGVRLHLHGAAGEYLPPKGNHRKVNAGWFEDNYGEFINGRNPYAYIRGECVADLPLGTVYVEISRGYEVTPVRESVEIAADTNELVFELDRVLDWRGKGWVTADTHVHFLTPTTAVLEGEAEDINVVNLLASQWGEMFSNVSDFDGRTNHSNTLPGNDGEFLCRVGTENRMQILGHISLLGYSGEMIHPLCSGGPSESALGDFQEVTMADWAQRCLDQKGLVVMPHAPNPQLERVADVVLDVVNAIEFMTFSPFSWQLMPAAVADWYRFLNAGYHLPITGGSDKMSADALLGGIRTYTQLGDRDFNYESWMDAVRTGHTFVTIGPLLDMRVEEGVPGSTIELSAGGGTLNVSWNFESVRVPVTAIEVIEGGRTVSDEKFDGVLAGEGSVAVAVEASTWIAVRLRGGYRPDSRDMIAAHTSAVRVHVDDKPVYNPQDAYEMLKQIEGAIAYVDTLASRPDAERFRKMQLTLESAYNRLHQRMHQHGVFHEHGPLHDHGHEH